LDSRVDGVVFIAPRPDSPALRRISSSNLPYAIVAANDHNGPSYAIDNAQGTKLALEHLYALGHRRIAHIAGNLALTDAHIRLETYRTFMAERGLEVGEHLVFMGDYCRSSGFRAGYEMRDPAKRPTAVFCANDDMAFGLMDAFHVVGIRVPEDVSVVGFDDVSVASSYRPPLTTVRQPIEEMSSAALHAVVEQAETGREATGALFYPELVVRGSTAILSEESIQ
jgi:DNA-binding LacI/PurR family transcriptional regulator